METALAALRVAFEQSEETNVDHFTPEGEEVPRVSDPAYREQRLLEALDAADRSTSAGEALVRDASAGGTVPLDPARWEKVVGRLANASLDLGRVEELGGLLATGELSLDHVPFDPPREDHKSVAVAHEQKSAALKDAAELIRLGAKKAAGAAWTRGAYARDIQQLRPHWCLTSGQFPFALFVAVVPARMPLLTTSNGIACRLESPPVALVVSSSNRRARLSAEQEEEAASREEEAAAVIGAEVEGAQEVHTRLCHVQRSCQALDVFKFAIDEAGAPSGDMRVSLRSRSVSASAEVVGREVCVCMKLAPAVNPHAAAGGADQDERKTKPSALSVTAHAALRTLRVAKQRMSMEANRPGGVSSQRKVLRRDPSLLRALLRVVTHKEATAGAVAAVEAVARALPGATVHVQTTPDCATVISVGYYSGSVLVSVEGSQVRIGNSRVHPSALAQHLQCMLAK
eukprot:m51a1_g2794 hypothetical protein (458) ;mRNA; f:65860-68307